jgi:glycosyltransferase involved in cell wall biosynthesis
MRILHVAARLSQRGGADIHLLGVLGELLRRGCEVVLAVGRDDGTATSPAPVVAIPGLDAAERAPVAGALESQLRSLAPDVVHVHNVVNPEALEWAAAVDAVVTVQDHRGFCPGRGKHTLNGRACGEVLAPEVCAGCFTDNAYFGRILATTLERLAALRRFRRVSVLSRYMQRELIAAGVAAGGIHVIPPFVHGLDPAAEAGGPPCVLFVGRLVAAKGVDDAVAAWELSGLELPLVFAGTGPERARLEAAGFEVLGWVPHERLSAVYRRARALVFPPRWQEPFGIAGLEALAMGVPVAAWDSGGVAEWHPGDGLAAWGDLDGLAIALRRAAGRRAAPPAGFGAGASMEALLGLYRAGAHSRAAIPS